MRKFLSLILFIVFSNLLLAACAGKKPSAEQTAPGVAVKTEIVKLAPIEDSYEAVGAVRSAASSVLSARILGVILAIRAREGDRVRAGQLLVQLDDRDAMAQVRKAQAGLQEARQGLDEVARSIAAAESAKASADANKELATSTFQRFKTLLERRSVSQQEFDEVQAKYRSAVAEADRAREMREALLARKAQIASRIEQAEADVANARIAADYSRITSPIDGIVTAKHAEVGSMAAPGVPLLTVEDNTKYRLEVSVEESRLSAIHLGQQAFLQIDSLTRYVRSASEPFVGQVSEIVPEADPASRTFTVKIDLPASASKTSPSALRSGLYGKARFAIGEKTVITIPIKAVIERGQLVQVYVVDQTGTARLRLIKLGKRTGERVEALSGLSDGDRVVIEGVESLADGSKVR